MNEKLDVKRIVKSSYGKIALSKGGEITRAGMKIQSSPKLISRKIGYSDQEIDSVPSGANLGLGCGNPHLIAGVQDGEIVVDLGSGAGFDSFIASKKVGPSGRVIGIDMTEEMVSLSRKMALDNGYLNVDFILAEIENLPIGNSEADLVISNCVINLSANKQKVYDEIYRILKPGGRIAISDVVLVNDLTEEMKSDENLYCGWVTGASSVEELEVYLKNAGFKDLDIRLESVSKEYAKKWSHNLKVGEYIMSGYIKAFKL